jgi:translation initiation factor 1 (eIF-1/SUI1)
MNPFEDIQTNNTNTKETSIEIWIEANGRKKNTFISGWNIPEKEIKEHIRVIKKKNGCNGSYKDIPNESNDGLQKVIQLQGDHSEYINQYLIANGIDKTQIKIKG